MVRVAKKQTHSSETGFMIGIQNLTVKFSGWNRLIDRL